MFAQSFHPAMRFVGGLRREIGIRTIFNFLGPLTNPAGAQHQLLGVGDAALAPKLAEALGRLGTRRAFVVHGEDGLDEVSLSAPTSLQELRQGRVHAFTLSPEDAGLRRATLAELKGGMPAENATRLRSILGGASGADRDFVLINAATALLAAERAEDLRGAVRIAAAAIDSGAATRALDDFVATTQSFGEEGTG